MRVLIDIDHVISDSSRRDHLIGLVSWDEYHESSINDEPVPEIVALVKALSDAGHEVVGFTVRPERYRQLTNRWMLRHNVMLSDILMRADDDFRGAVKIKIDLVGEIKPDLVIDDRDDVCDAFQLRGVTTMKVTVR